MDTIFAMATAPGKAGVAIVRVSGPDVRSVVDAMCPPHPEPRQMVLRRIGSAGQVFDRGLIVTFPGHASFTGEDVLEFHLHGSIAVVKAVLDCLGGIEGLRHALPGEFTRRAFENGRLDLTQVEGLADLIDAETEAQRRQSQRVFSGEFGRLIDDWRSELLKASATMAASLDFPDDDVPATVLEGLQETIDTVVRSLETQIVGQTASERLQNGYEVAIVGPPNVGKSTLLNYLAGRDAALVSDVPGTTRDVIEVRMDILGYPVTLLDTAGLRDTADVIESMGVEAGIRRAAGADLRIILADASETLPVPDMDTDIVLFGKQDHHVDGRDGISGLTGNGVDAALARIATHITRHTNPDVLATRPRHRQSMLAGVAALRAAAAELSGKNPRIEIVSEEVQAAAGALEQLIGHMGVEDVLGEVFSTFCMGK